jgi:hypothetical protein
VSEATDRLKRQLEDERFMREYTASLYRSLVEEMDQWSKGLFCGCPRFPTVPSHECPIHGTEIPAPKE